MRVLIGAVGHESNSFTPLMTRLEDFQVFFSDQVLNRQGWRGSLEGMAETLRLHGLGIIPSLAASATPGGIVERPAYEGFKKEIIAKAAGVDGVCLYLHGAMRAEGLDYADEDLLVSLRKAVGPHIPISVAADSHGNLTPGMAEAADAIVAFHTAPHDDEFETGAAAARLLIHRLKGGSTSMGFAKVPMLLPGEMAQTALPPMSGLMRLVAETEKMPGVLSASLANGHCWADVPDIGVAVVVVTDGERRAAQGHANRIAAEAWARRREFSLSAEAYRADEAVEMAMAAGEPTVFLSDSGDNPGAGGTSDGTSLLAELVARKASNALFASIWDPGAVSECIKAGVGSEVSCLVGGKIDPGHASPLQVRGYVRSLHDGVPYNGSRRLPPAREKIGPMAVLKIGGLDLVLTSTRQSFEDPMQLRLLGLEPLQYRIVALKRGYLTTAFSDIAPRAILALTPGATNCDVRGLAYKRLKRPVWPLDQEMEWSPE